MSYITLPEGAFIKIDEIGAANWYPNGITNQPKKEVVATYKSDGTGGYYKEWPAAGTVLYGNNELLGIASYFDGIGDVATANSIKIEISEVSMYSTRATYEYHAGGGKSYYKQPPANDTMLITQGDTEATGRQECRLSVYPIGRYSPSIWRQFAATGELSPVYKEVFPPEGAMAWSSADSEADGDDSLRVYIDEIDFHTSIWKEFETNGSQIPNEYIREKCPDSGTVLLSAYAITEPSSEDPTEDDVVLYDFFADGGCGYYKLPTPTTNTSTSGTSTSGTSTSGVSGTETTETSGASGTDTTETSGSSGTGTGGETGGGTGGTGGTGDDTNGNTGDGTGSGTGGGTGGGTGSDTGTTTTSGTSGSSTKTIVSFTPDGEYVPSYDTDMPSRQYGTITWSDDTTSEGYTETIGIYTYGPFAN